MKKFFILICSLYIQLPQAQEFALNAQTARQHVLQLTEVGGRLTGSDSEKHAADYIVKQLQAMGLKPWHAEDYLQPFSFIAGTSLGKGNKLIVNAHELVVDKDFRPLVFSGTGEFTQAPVVFAGYGISESESDQAGESYDSYVHLDVTDKWVLIMRFTPEDINTEQRIKLNHFSNERSKVLNARKKGAKGVIFVNGPNSQVKAPLIPLSFDASTGSGSMPVVSVTTQIADKWFKNIGKDWKKIQKKLDAGEFVMGFEFKDIEISAQIDLHQDTQTGNNVIAYMPGNTDLPALIIGAHYDHLGHGETLTSLAKEAERGLVHPGADDNASGVSGVLTVAEFLMTLKNTGKFTPKRDVVFAFWSGEELGLLGSNNFVKSIGKDNLPKQFMANINLDMIGRLQKNLILQGVGSSSQWSGIIERRNAPVGLNISTQDDAYLPTDAMSFYLYQVPVLSVFTGSHAQYHSPRDTPDLLNYTGMAQISKLIALISRELSLQETPMDYIQQKPKETQNAGRGMRAYLGTIPEYGYQGEGVLLSDTTKGSPAELAGIKGGDVLIELAGTKIENIYDFTYILEALKIGKSISAKVIRDKQTLELQVTPASRQ